MLQRRPALSNLSLVLLKAAELVAEQAPAFAQ
jgi:hypothetical protein